MEGVHYWTSPTVHLIQRHFNQCILNTSGCYGGLEGFLLDIGRSKRHRNNSLIGCLFNLDTRRWTIGTMWVWKIFMSMEDVHYWKTTVHLLQKHCSQYIMNTSG